MKILLVVHGFPPAANGGTEIYAEALARTLSTRHGDDVLVLARDADLTAPEYRLRRETRDGLSIAWINNTYRDTTSFAESYRNEAIGAIAARVIDDYSPDVAHVHHLTNLSTTIVPALADRRIPCVVTLHDYWLLCHRGQLLDRHYRACEGPDSSRCHDCLDPAAGAGLGRLSAAPAMRAFARALPAAPARWLRKAGEAVATMTAADGETVRQAEARLAHMRDVCARATLLLAPSTYLRDRFEQAGIPADRIRLCELGIDRHSVPARPRTSSSLLRLGFLGTLMVSKAPDILLRAFQRLPAGSATVDLIGAYAAYHGDDRYREQLRPLVAQPGVRTHGGLTHENVVDVLASIDVLVVPSIWPENSPLVIREAFLAGIPVVASNIGGIPEAVIDGRNGLLFRAGDADDLHRVLSRLLNEPDLLETLRAGIQQIRTIDDDATSTREIYSELIAERRPHPVTHSPTHRFPRVSAIVLHHRTPDETRLAVGSLLASRRAIDDIIIVNNDADDGQTIVDGGSRVRYLSTGRNLGFAGGMNAGIRAALESGAERVLLVNSDVIVPPDCLAHLERGLAAVDGAGIAGAVVIARSDPSRVASLGLTYAPRTGRMRHRGFGDRVSSLAEPPERVVDAVAGCLMLVTRPVFDAIGLLDEDYFFTFEELDFCLRARRARFLSVVVADARVHHEGGRSIGSESPKRLYFAARNHLRLAHRAAPDTRAFAALARSASILALNVAHAVRSRGGSLTQRLAAVARGASDYAAGRWGDRA